MRLLCGYEGLRLLYAGVEGGWLRRRMTVCAWRRVELREVILDRVLGSLRSEEGIVWVAQRWLLGGRGSRCTGLLFIDAQ